jgi:cytochrome c-type biogenesis protein CcsB
MTQLFEIRLIYTALSLYIICSVLFNISFVFDKKKFENYGYKLAFVALIIHAVAILYRWVQAGHGPYISRYEELSSVVWVWICFFLIFTKKRVELRSLGAIILPLSVLMMGWVLLSDSTIKELPSTYYTYWLIVHILFAKLSFGAGLMAVAISVLYLRMEGRESSSFYKKLPPPNKMDILSYKFMTFCFIFDTFMIIAGAIWAHYAWGNYWSWSDLEVWSLITWGLTGLYLHLRFTFKFKGKASAWMIVGIFVLSFLTMFGIPFVSDKVHKGLV